MLKPFDPLDYLRLARRIALDASDEADLRAAVSRAYYAIFLIVRAKAHILGRESLHQQAKAWVQSKDLAAGGEYQALRDMRVHADYNLKLGDMGHDPAYDDWSDNWKNTERYCDSLIQSLTQW